MHERRAADDDAVDDLICWNVMLVDAADFVVAAVADEPRKVNPRPGESAHPVMTVEMLMMKTMTNDDEHVRKLTMVTRTAMKQKSSAIFVS